MIFLQGKNRPRELQDSLMKEPKAQCGDGRVQMAPKRNCCESLLFGS